MKKFILKSSFSPEGDQPQAIKKLTDGILKGKKYQTLLGVTGSGKTFTIANVIKNINLPVLVISHNKTLAAQLYSEFKEFFPENAVEYFVSYYDYYQPEAYIPQSDTYIEKDSSINDRIDRLRLAATSSIMSRKDVIIVASVSCIYNLGSPTDYKDLLVSIKTGLNLSMYNFMKRLIDIQYERNDIDFARGTFRVRGNTIDIFPAYLETAFRIEFSNEKVSSIKEINPTTAKIVADIDNVAIYPAKHFVAKSENIERALLSIEQELGQRLKVLKSQNKLLEAQRLNSRTKYDMEMLKELGYCNGVENYSRHISQRPETTRPACLIDYFDGEFLTIIDESHVSIPQINGMYNGDRARKQTLVEYGFRLPSCLDNRPLKFEEFEKLTYKTIFVSATPGDYELQKTNQETIQQIIRPTGLIDPEIVIRPINGQVDDLIKEVKKRAKAHERVLVITLTKRLAEDLTNYFAEIDVKVKYIHSEVDTIERVKILRDLRAGDFDCLVGVNLLREGLDLPEVSLVAVLDADKEGFLRSETSLIQVAGRAARHIRGLVILYADTITNSMRKMIDETNRRRKIQVEYNKKHNVTPKTIQKAINDGIASLYKAKDVTKDVIGADYKEFELSLDINELQKQMELAARNLQFEKAVLIRDKLFELKNKGSLLCDKTSGKKKNNIKKKQ